VRKLTTIAGRGVTAEPFRSMAEIGSVPGMGPRGERSYDPLKGGWPKMAIFARGRHTLFSSRSGKRPPGG
jgi:hypothetical protein